MKSNIIVFLLTLIILCEAQNNSTWYCYSSESCSNHGICNSDRTDCICDEHYISDIENHFKCSIFVDGWKCNSPIDCSNHGICNSDKTDCICDEHYISDRESDHKCSIFVNNNITNINKTCNDQIDCSNNGYCSNDNKSCICDKFHTTINDEKPQCTYKKKKTIIGISFTNFCWFIWRWSILFRLYIYGFLSIYSWMYFSIIHNNNW